MTKNWMIWINRALLGLIMIFTFLAFFYLWKRPSQIPIPKLSEKKMILPEGAFAKTEEEYDRIGPPLLQLKFFPMTLQLPDLRNVIVYYGRNERPDANEGESLLHFSITGSKDSESIPPGEPLYLVYDKDQPRIKYVFSPNNKETSLWIEAVPLDKEASVSVSMRNEYGQVIRKPEQFAQFNLKEKQMARYGASRWEIGKWKVDGTLLARQRARWYGKDLFLERHGGEEYRDKLNKQRIDFGEKDELYSIYLGEGDGAAWIGGKWKQVSAGEDTQKYPLLVLSKVEDRLLKFDLWDVGGKGKVSLNVIKSTETAAPRNLEKEFKFVGARTRSQLMFEVKGERILISPKDWYLFTEGKWVKLSTPEQIDAYVDRRVTGPLFVIDEIFRDDGRQLLVGLIYNTARTDVKLVEIPLQQGATPVVKDSPKPLPRKNVEEAEEEKTDEEGEVEEVIPEGQEEYIEKIRERYKGKIPEEHIERIKTLRGSFDRKNGQ
ncbi:putative membrane protein [Waddlia chondrophila 2032/99]|uniref:Putative membrane protein n=2 Tax=Waddlia chondrophila TaxID=71667 RepID=D6YT57_WADCW|nr:hypothetical protein [Waddlia chondrophila]ADI39252.1 putative membrane protein [Waddlia chondrophila WSU 86-1044]CCB91642.1 putative membrane protein [Waddlia chondrophila 2032/99]